MMIEGRVWKDKKFWLAEIPLLDYLTQGHTRKEALEMAKDIVITGVEKDGFEVTLIKGPENTFRLTSNDTNALLAHMLRRQRQKHGLTVREVSSRLHSASPNAFSVYERGKSAPTMIKLEELFHAIDPSASLVLQIAKG
jgi:predicted RNase H-like HicB family nuclease